MKANPRARGVAYVALGGCFCLTLYYAVIARFRVKGLGFRV